jgi:hypothetical protein
MSGSTGASVSRVIVACARSSDRARELVLEIRVEIDNVRRENVA